MIINDQCSTVKASLNGQGKFDIKVIGVEARKILSGLKNKRKLDSCKVERR